MKMADEEAEIDRSPEKGIGEAVLKLRERLQKLEEVTLRQSNELAVHSSAIYCQEFCRTLLEFAGLWSIEEDPLPLVEVYIVALRSYAQASPYLSLQCENVPLVVERLSLSFVELLLSLKKNVPEALWKQFKLSVQFSSTKLQENGISQLSILVGLCQCDGVWSSQVLKGLLSGEKLPTEQVEKFLMQEGPVLLEIRVKQLMKDNQTEKAAALAEACSRCPAFQEKSSFKQLYLVCLCATSERDQLMEALSKEDCRDALEMICNLESDGDDKAAFSLCSAFLTRQLLQGDTYCAWELTLFWSKLLKRLEPSEQAFLDQCRQMSLLSKTMYHILFLIKVVQSEIDNTGLPVCIEMCIRALRMESDDGNTKSSVCKTISCLLPTDLEVKRASQLTQFLLESTVDAYYVVETLYNEPDEKVDAETMPIPNSLRCELLLVLKTHWPFDPEFWDWRTLKRQCLALMGEEASIVSSIDLLNDTEEPQQEEDSFSQDCFNNTSEEFTSDAYNLPDLKERRQKNRELKKLRGKDFVYTKYRNWQAYMQYCVLCDKEFLGHRIVRHAQIHFSNGLYRCPICAQSFSSRDVFLPHVKSHVKQSCKERLNALKTAKELPSPEVVIPDPATLKLKEDNALKEKFVSQLKNGMFLPHVEIRLSRCDMETTDNYVCPVGKCRRSFKFQKNLVAHVKSHGNNKEAKTFLEMRRKKVICQYCRRHFVSVTHLNDHLQAHNGENPYICVQLNCKASFQSCTELTEHKKTHPVFKAKCMFPNCGKIFSQAFKLYDHEELHYERFPCKVKDCGRVFPSLKLLDLHQENHISIKKERTSTAKPQDMQPASLIKQMLTSKNQPESSHGKPSSEIVAHHKYEQSPVTTECSRKPSEIPAGPQYKVRSLQTSQSENLINSRIQPENPNVSGGLGVHSFDSTGPLKSKDSNAQTTKSQPQMFHTNVVTGSLGYKSECNLPLPEQKEPICSSRLPSVLPLHKPIEPASQPLAPVKLEKTITSVTAPPAVEKKQYHCPLENCRRCYVSLQSVNRHMRKVHPDLYEKRKHARTPMKVTCVLAPKLPLVKYGFLGNQQNGSLPVIGVPRQNTIQFPFFMTTTSPNSAPVQSQSSHNQNASGKLENVSSPIVLSQLGSDGNPNGQKWQPTSANERIQHSGSPSNMHGMAQVECMNTALLLNTPSFSIMATTTPAETLQVPPLGSAPLSVLPSYMTGTKEPSQQSQMQSSRTSSSADGVQSEQKHAEHSSESASQNNINTQTQNLPGFPNNDPNCNKQTKRQRSKWPAIVRNGKFVCCLCFKEFDNPKSLGGHLSRGAVCKPDMPGLNTDLTKPPVHVLHSKQTICPQPPSCLNQNNVVRQSVINGSTSTNLNFPSDKVPVYGTGTLDGIKETCAETNMPDYYNQTPNPFPRPPYSSAERLPGNSVIHPTETVQANCQGPSFPAAQYSQPSFKTFDRNQSSNPTDCQIICENLTVGPGNTKRREHYNSEGQSSDTTVETKDANLNSAPQAKLGDSQANSSVHERLTETQRETSNQDVKRRLRERMLAEQFQRGTRNMNTATNLNHPVSFGSVGNPPRTPEVQQLLSDPNSNSVHRNSAVIPETSGGTKQFLNTQSFTGFRESSATRPEVPSPKSVIIHDADLEPSLSSASQQQCITEIQSAFEKLDLATEFPAQISVPVEPNPTAVISETGSTNSRVICSGQFKPFACENKNCKARFMTGDAFWKHLSKRHNYTVDMVKMARKRYFLNNTPFKCQKCNKSFTRNTTLRVHYHSAHKLSAKEVEDMGLRCRQVTITVSQATTPTHSSVDNKTNVYSSLDAVKRDCSSQASVPSSNVAIGSDKCHDVSHVTPFHHLQAADPCSQPNGLPPLNQSAIKSETKKPRNVEIRKKTKERKPSPDHSTSPFRPYRCIHQGCEAAFTIQHNLILHYRVVHQSALSALAVSRDHVQNNGLDEVKRQDVDYPEEPVFKISEFRCQVKDCSRIFQEVPNLVQHYLRLHHIGVDNIGVLLSNIKPQTFICGYQGCPALFPTACRYIGHVREEHNDMLTQPEQLNSSFRCEFEGCNRSYATKSNMLRHFMKIHGKFYRAKLKKERIKRAKMKRTSSALRYQITKTMNGKENIESHRKIWKRGDPKRKKRSKTNIWTTYGKLSLKTKVEASGLCTKKFPLQYPCMIIGCESVMKSERHILKHYLGHGLSEKYLEHQRSHFIFCKKAPRLKWSSLRSDDSKSDSELSSSELTAETSPDEDDSGGSKLALRRRTSAKIPIVLFDSKLSNIEGFAGSVVFRRKRGRPRKFPEKVKPKKIPRPKLDHDCSRVKESNFSSPALMQEEMTKLNTPLATFKPMGFEMSFLKFLEQSNKSDHSLTMRGDVPDRFRKSSIQNAEDTCVRFRNHEKLKSLNKVKIIIDGAFAGVTNLMLAQLQDMWPTVVLRGE